MYSTKKKKDTIKLKLALPYIKKVFVVCHFLPKTLTVTGKLSPYILMQVLNKGEKSAFPFFP